MSHEIAVKKPGVDVAKRTGDRVASKSSALLTGVFAGPVIGLKYRTPTCAGVTNDKGEFQYRHNETVTFSIGNLVLGSTMGADRVNLSQLISRVDGRIEKVCDPVITNMARLLQTLDQDGDVENGVTIAPQVHDIVGNRRINFGLEGVLGMFTSQEAVEKFSEDPLVIDLLAELNRTPGVFTANKPRRLRSAAAARNELRRNIRGIVKMTDVKIPLRNGSYLYADVFRPAAEGKYPVVMNFGVYGKAFVHGCICNEEDAEKHEQMEDRYFSGNPDGYLYENHESINTVDWIPKGYALVRVDGPGTGKSPGTICAFGRPEAEAYYDAIEWAGVQQWSNGNIGTWGLSYYAMDAHNVASLQPPHLKAIVAIGTDTNSYEENLYHGGILSEQFWTFWWEYLPSKTVCGPLKHKDFRAIAKAHPFNDPTSKEIYGPEAEVMMSPDLSKVVVPQWVGMVTTHTMHMHQLGSSETYIHSASQHKKLSIMEDWFMKSYSGRKTAEFMAFFDYWLKGIDNGIMDMPPVEVEVRTGDGGYYVQYENEWPIARTQYTKWYLDATPSSWEGDGRRKDFLRLSRTAPSEERSASYSAEVDVTVFPHKIGKTPSWATGVSFVTDPMPEDMVLAGYMKAALWVSSSSSDMDIYVCIRAIDENNVEVNYSGPPELPELNGPTTVIPPFGKGWLKVSHRKLDPQRSNEYRPKHTHLAADYAPLKGNEVVPVEVEIVPSTALIKKGHRIRVDIQPYDGAGVGWRHVYDETYHDGATNSVYTGPSHLSYVQLPVIPAADR
ncbi:MAG TPA: CocE/NonD family hydrolase [Steroidobacter sp.]|uniref:CocE/NonD family hydrolase n=1 Tax=Steroidobacter sp. TaxID=1978227 RepID=UPI002EDB7A43